MAERIVHRKSLRSTTGPTKRWVCPHKAFIYSSTRSASPRDHACPETVLAGPSPSPTVFCWHCLISVQAVVLVRLFDTPSTPVFTSIFWLFWFWIFPLMIHLFSLFFNCPPPSLCVRFPFFLSSSVSFAVLLLLVLTALTCWLISHFIIRAYKITANRYSVCVFVPVLLPPLPFPISHCHQYLFWYPLLSGSLMTAAVIQE